MNLKNKILLTAIVLLLSICIFNTDCFASNSYILKDDIVLNVPEEWENYYYTFFLIGGDDYSLINRPDKNYCIYIYLSTTPIYFDSTFNSDNNTYSYNVYTSDGSNFVGWYGISFLSEQFTQVNIDEYISSVNYNISVNSFFVHNYDSSAIVSICSNQDLTLDDEVIYVTDNPKDTGNPERGTDQGGNTDNTIGGTESDSENTTDSDDSGGILSGITQGFENVVDFFKKLLENLGNLLSSIGGWFTELFTKLGDWFSGLAESIGTFFTNLGNDITNKWNEWKEQRRLEKEEERIKEEEENNKQNQSSQDMSNSLNSATEKFTWYNNVIKNTNDMINVITSAESSATFKVNVNSKYYKGDLAIIDLSWYAPYKEIGDNVICIFCYLSFLWSFFVRLPSILSGSGASNYSISQIKEDNK